ncbi:MAG: cohesin domain-containing protein [Nitrospirae bacterium]|nr:cohesin domain-containing protein [Nitrospirota bacterium]
MRKKVFIAILLSSFILPLLFVPTSIASAALLSVSSTDNGIFQITGSDMTGVASMDITLSYDAATLSNPRVVVGPLISGAMTAVNPNVPGILRIAIIRTAPVTGNGLIATLSFDLLGNGQGTITSLNAKLSNINGAPLTTIVQVSNPPVTTAEGTTSAALTEAHDSVTAVAPSSMIVIVSQPGKREEAKPTLETGIAKEQNELPLTQESTGEPNMPREKTDSVMSSSGTLSNAQRGDMGIYSQESVLARFKAYRGKRTPKAFIALFDQAGVACRQEPPIAFSDGKSVVKVVFLTPPGKITFSDVAVMGARLVSLKSDTDNTNTWIIELIPEKGGYKAGFAISRGEAKMVFPLTITPKISMKPTGSGSMTAADFTVFLKAGESAKLKKFDLNGDGKRDYIDDYIFTANYVSEVKESAIKKRK